MTTVKERTIFQLLCVSDQCKPSLLMLRMSLLRDTFDVPIGLRMVLLPMDVRYVLKRPALDEPETYHGTWLGHCPSSQPVAWVSLG